jgi:hypothetical protein
VMNKLDEAKKEGTKDQILKYKENKGKKKK